MKHHIALTVALVAAVSSAVIAFAGWQIGSINLKQGDLTISGGYTSVSVEAISQTATGNVTVYHITHVPVTNTLATLTLSGGYAVASTSQVALKDGDILYTVGQALTNGSAHVTIRR